MGLAWRKTRSTSAMLWPAASAGLPSVASLRVVDGLRGLAALTVLLAHAQWFLWLGEPGRRLGTHPSALRVILYPFTFGRTAVLLFFVISGFCIHFRAAQGLAAEQLGGSTFSFCVGRYAWRRLRRIMPPLLLALGLTLALDRIGAAVNPAFYARHTPYAGFNSLAVPRHDIGVLLGNLCFLQGFAVPAFGADDPLWSLAYEGFFYALYPGLLLARRWWGMARCTVVVGAAALLCYGGYTHEAGEPWLIGVYLAVWWLGAFVAERYVHGTPPRGVLGPVLLGSLTVLAVAIPFAYRAPAVYNALAGCAFAGLLAVLVLWPLAGGLQVVRERAAACFAPAGAISYSLYLLHVPLLSLLAAWWLRDHPLLPASSALLWAGVALSLGLAWLAYATVERPLARAPRPPEPAATHADMEPWRGQSRSER